METNTFDFLEKMERAGCTAFSEAKTLAEFRDLEVQFLGRKSELGLFLKSLALLPPEERHKVGKRANEAKRAITAASQSARARLSEASFDVKSEWIDVTDQPCSLPVGHLHILTTVENEIVDIFRSLGFDVADGPELETEFYNFDALNIPADHPARDMQDTFWIREDTRSSQDPQDHRSARLLLRTHTSPVQVRYMETHTPPFRIIVPGRIFRSEATDASHEHTFYQFESLFVDKSVSVGNFKYVAELFFSRFFGKRIGVRLRPSFFPFVEPGFEFDIACTVCDGKGCSSCHGTGWLEVGGAGMVHQSVFEAAGYERDRWSGFAWGFGTNRLAMMKYKIPDVRLFQSGDLRFLNQF
ncbi:MAG: phenylalanine--tRNA ligase subunit alpha [Candidatus Moraniibacteriota bacterium]|nr:MAG: phenylalanine--tRNA ligase subunit alpha [Candidatus Moranbacteria bacterium]